VKHGKTRPEGPKLEARTCVAKPGSGVLGEGRSYPLSPPARDLGEQCKQTHGVWGKAPAKIDVCVFLITRKASAWCLTAFDGKNSGEARSIACHRKVRKCFLEAETRKCGKLLLTQSPNDFFVKVINYTRIRKVSNG